MARPAPRKPPAATAGAHSSGQTPTSAFGATSPLTTAAVDVGVLVDGRLDAVEAPEHTRGWWPDIVPVFGPLARRCPEAGPRPSAESVCFTP